MKTASLTGISLLDVVAVVIMIFLTTYYTWKVCAGVMVSISFVAGSLYVRGKQAYFICQLFLTLCCLMDKAASFPCFKLIACTCGMTSAMQLGTQEPH